MRISHTSVLLSLLLAVTACGASTASTSNGATGSQSSSSMPGQPTDPSVTQPNQAQPDSRAIKLRPIHWSKAEAGDGRQLYLDYTIAGIAECSTLGRIDATETASSVTITLLVGQLPNANCGGAQPQLAASFVTSITLQEPLGKRPVRDGAN